MLHLYISELSAHVPVEKTASVQNGFDHIRRVRTEKFNSHIISQIFLHKGSDSSSVLHHLRHRGFHHPSASAVGVFNFPGEEELPTTTVHFQDFSTCTLLQLHLTLDPTWPKMSLTREQFQSPRTSLLPESLQQQLRKMPT